MRPGFVGRGVLSGLIIGYLGMVALLFVFQRQMQYFPRQDLQAPAAYGADLFEEIELATVDGLVLKSWYAPARGGRPTILHFHGNGGHIAHRLGRMLPLAEAGYGVLLAEYRGYGGNPGSPTEEGLYTDGRTARAYLDSLGLKPEQIVIMGESLGTGVAVKIASEGAARAMILESPFSSAVDIGQAAYFFVPVRWLMWDRFESIELIDKIDMPLLVIHGDNDRVVPLKYGQKLFDRAREPKSMHILKGAGHGNITRFGSIEIELDFLRQLER